MTWRIDWSDSSEADLEAIWDWLAEHDIATAERTVRAIDAVILLLGDTPRMGRMRADILPGLRAVIKLDYLILYRLDEEDNRLEIVRIIDQRRDLSALFD